MAKRKAGTTKGNKKTARTLVQNRRNVAQKTHSHKKMTAALEKLRELVERFSRNYSDYKEQGYKEAQLRKEFLDPFFEQLGWDVNNRGGCAEAYKEVIHEDALKIGAATEAPDYCFRVGGVRKFFVEAKKPAVDIANDEESSYQLRRYAWSSKLPLSILTNFEYLAVYDCRFRPSKSDRPSKARVLLIRYDEFVSRWSEFENLFSREAILKGYFDKFLDSQRSRGTAEVDEEFLEEIEDWRKRIARNLALRNPHLTQPQLNSAVQLIIDRIIFLRICEDRGIEQYGQLSQLLDEPEIYKRLFYVFERADDKYNSGLFHFSNEKGREEPPDTLTRKLTLDDNVSPRHHKETLLS